MSASPLPPQDPPIPTQEAEDQLPPGKMLLPEQFPWQDPTPAQLKHMSPGPVEPLPQLPMTLEQDLLNRPIDPAFSTEVFLNLYKQSAENSARNADLEMDSVLDRVPIGKIKEYATVSTIGPNGPMILRVPVYEHQDADQVIKKYAEAQYRTSENLGMSAAEGVFFPLKFIPGWRREHEEARAKSAVPEALTGGVEFGASLLPISLYSRIYMGLNRALDLGEAAYMSGRAVGMTNAMRQMAGEPVEEVPGFLTWLGERAGRKSLDKMSTAEINEAVQAWRELAPLKNPHTGMYEVNHLAQPTPSAAVFEAFNKNKQILQTFAENLGYLKEGNPAARLVLKQATAGAGTGVALPATGALAGATPEERSAYLKMAPVGAAGGAVLGAAIPGAIRDLAYFKGLKGKPAEAPPIPPDPYPEGGPGSALLRMTSYRPAGLSDDAERVVMQLEDMARLGNPEPLRAAQPLLATADQANRALPAFAESLESPLINTRPNFKTLEAPTDASWFENPQQADTDQVLLAGHLAGVSDAFIVGKLFPLSNPNKNPALPLNGIPVVQLDGRLVAVVPDAGQPTEKEITSSSRIVTDPYGPEIDWEYRPASDSPVVYYKDTHGGLRIDRSASEARTGQKDWLVPGRYTGEIANQLPPPIVDAYFSDINSTFPPEKTLQTLALTRGDQADLEVLLDQELTDEKILVAQKEVQEAPSAALPEVPEAPRWRSGLREAVARAAQGSKKPIPLIGLRNYAVKQINRVTGGVTAEELEDTGLDQWLRDRETSKTPTTWDDIIGYLNENWSDVRVERSQAGLRPGATYDSQARAQEELNAIEIRAENLWQELGRVQDQMDSFLAAAQEQSKDVEGPEYDRLHSELYRIRGELDGITPDRLRGLNKVKGDINYPDYFTPGSYNQQEYRIYANDPQTRIPGPEAEAEGLANVRFKADHFESGGRNINLLGDVMVQDFGVRGPDGTYDPATTTRLINEKQMYWGKEYQEDLEGKPRIADDLPWTDEEPPINPDLPKHAPIPKPPFRTEFTARALKQVLSDAVDEGVGKIAWNLASTIGNRYPGEMPQILLDPQGNPVAQKDSDGKIPGEWILAEYGDTKANIEKYWPGHPELVEKYALDIPRTGPPAARIPATIEKIFGRVGRKEVRPTIGTIETKGAANRSAPVEVAEISLLGENATAIRRLGFRIYGREPKPGQQPRGRSEAYQRKNQKGIPKWAFEQLDDADKVSHLKARITEAKQNQSVYELQALNPDKLGPGTPRYNTSWSPNPSQLADLKAHYSAAINELGDFGRAIKAGLKPIKDLTPQEFTNRIEKYLNNPPELDASVPSSEVHEYWKRFYGADTEKALTAERRRTYRAIEQFRAGVPDFANLPITGEDVQAFEDAMHQTLSNAGQQVVKGQRELLKDASPEHAAALAHSSSTIFAAHRMLLTLGNLGFRAQLRPEESLGHTRTQNTLELWTEGAEKRKWNVYHIMRSGLDGYTTEHSDWTRKFTRYLIAMARDPAFNVELADALQSGRGLQSAGTRKFDIKTGSLPGSKSRYQFTLKEAVNEFRNFHELIYPRLKTAVIARLENSAAALHSAMDEARDELIAAVDEADLATFAMGNPVNKPLDLDKMTVEELDDLFTNNPDTITGRSVGKKNLRAMTAAIKRFGKFYKAYQREFKKIGEWEADKHKDPNYLTALHEATIDDLMAQIEDENSGLYMRSLGTKLRDDITKVRRSKKPTVKDMLKIFPSYVDQALKLIHIEPAMQKIYTDSPAPGAAPRGMYLRLPTDQQAIVEDWFRQIRGERNPLEAYYSRLLVGEMKYGKHSAASRAHKLVTGKNVPAQVQANLPANYTKNPLQDLAGPAQGGVYSLVVSLGNLAIQNALDKIPVALGRLAEEARLSQMVPAIPFQGTKDMAQAAGNALVTKATGRATTPPISQRMGSLNAMSDVLDDALTHPVQTLGYPANPIEAAMRKLASLTMLGPRATDGSIRAQEYYKNYRFAKRNGYTEDEAQEYARQKTATWMVSSGMGERSPRFQQWPGKLMAPLQQFYSGRVKGLYGGAVRNVATTAPNGILDKIIQIMPGFVGRRIDLRQPVPQDAPYGPPPEPPPAHWPERLLKYWIQQQANPSIGGLHERASSKARWASLRMLMMTGLGVMPVLAAISQFTGYPMSRLIPGLRYGAPLVEFPRDIYDWAMLETKRELMHGAGIEMSEGELSQLRRLQRQLKYRWIPVVGGDIRDWNKAKANREQMRRGLSRGIYPKPNGESQPQTFGEYLEKHGLKEPS